MGSSQSRGHGPEVQQPQEHPGGTAFHNAGAAGTEDIPMTVTGANAEGAVATADPIAAAYFGESSAMYFGPHFIVNSSDLTSPFLQDDGVEGGRRGLMERLRTIRRNTGGDVVGLEESEAARAAEEGTLSVEAVRNNVFWPDLVGGNPQDGLRGIPGVGVRRDITDEELATIRNLYKQPPPSEIRVTTTLQCLTNLKKNTLRLVPVPLTDLKPEPQILAPPLSDDATHLNLPYPSDTSHIASSSSSASPLSPSTEESPKPKSKFRLEFEFDSSVPCIVRVHWVVKEVWLELADGTRRIAYLPKSLSNIRKQEAALLSAKPVFEDPQNGKKTREVAGDEDGASSIKSKSFGPFPAGLYQKFAMPDNALLDPSALVLGPSQTALPSASLFWRTAVGAEASESLQGDASGPTIGGGTAPYYPLVIELQALDKKDALESKTLEEPGMPSVNSQSTYATLIPSKDGQTFELKVLKQKVMVRYHYLYKAFILILFVGKKIEGSSFTLQDVYGFTDPTGTGSLEPATPSDQGLDTDLQSMRECVVWIAPRYCDSKVEEEDKTRRIGRQLPRVHLGAQYVVKVKEYRDIEFLTLFFVFVYEAFHSLLQINLPKPFKLEKAASSAAVNVQPPVATTGQGSSSISETVSAPQQPMVLESAKAYEEPCESVEEKVESPLSVEDARNV
ncbi:hypothetical protein HDU67_007257 [Dinochytrium kinnereticum]|nr:hypothetical protein HDU67_007257 [Dinochytrium kinnereticum]